VRTTQAHASNPIGVHIRFGGCARSASFAFKRVFSWFRSFVVSQFRGFVVSWSRGLVIQPLLLRVFESS